MNQVSKTPWICLVTHGHFGQELVKSAEMIIGKITDIYCFSLIEGMSPEQLYTQIADRLAQAPITSLIFTDIYGGTPSNISSIFAKKYQYQVIAGLNLPMLIEAEMARHDIQTKPLSTRILDVGSQSIKDITQIINKR